MSTTGWIMAGVAAIIFARWGYLRLLARADRERAALYAQGGGVVPHGKDNVVPLASMLHEQDSAEAYDDLPERTDGRDMQSELRRAGWVETGPGYWVKNASREAEDMHGDGSLVIGPGCMDEIRARKAWADHWNARLALDFDGGAR